MVARLPTVVFVVAALLAGCGGSDPSESVREHFDAIVARDGDKACDQLTADLRADIERSEGGAGRTCADVMALAAGLNPSLEPDEIRDLEIDVDENDDEAVARFRNPLVRRDETIDLVRQDGDWKISSLETRPQR